MLRVDVSRRRCVKAEELSDSVEWSYDYGNLSGTAGDLHSSQSKFGTGVFFVYGSQRDLKHSRPGPAKTGQAQGKAEEKQEEQGNGFS